MKKIIYFMAVGLAFTALQVATVEAQDTAAGLVTGGANAPADCGGVPCPTGDDAHTGGAEDCAAMSTPALVAACWDRRSTHADGAHGGMAAGTTAMCGDVPCPTGTNAGMAPPSCAGGEEPMCGGEACPTPEQFAADPAAATAPGKEPMCSDGTPAMCGDEPCGPPSA